MASLSLLSACAPRGPAQPVVRPDFFTAEAPYLPGAHSHNNYDQRRPLVDALERGFASIEVDVVLSGRDLLVAHGPDELGATTSTLQALYLDPLRDVVRRNRGTVYGTSRPPLQLLIDVKTEADATYAVLHEVLGGYSDMLTTWVDGVEDPGAVSVVISGNRAVERIAGQSRRYAAIDGRLLEDRSRMAPAAMPLVSEDWEKLGPPVPEARLSRARAIVEEMHREGRKVRFWATPEDERLWRSLIALGVDYIGTDDPVRLERVLLETRALD